MRKKQQQQQQQGVSRLPWFCVKLNVAYTQWQTHAPQQKHAYLSIRKNVAWPSFGLLFFLFHVVEIMNVHGRPSDWRVTTKEEVCF